MLQGLRIPRSRSALSCAQIEDARKSARTRDLHGRQHWQANFEWFAHAPLAIEGVDAGAIELLRTGESPAPLTEDEQLVYDLAREIITWPPVGRLLCPRYQCAWQ